MEAVLSGCKMQSVTLHHQVLMLLQLVLLTHYINSWKKAPAHILLGVNSQVLFCALLWHCSSSFRDSNVKSDLKVAFLWRSESFWNVFHSRLWLCRLCQAQSWDSSCFDIAALPECFCVCLQWNAQALVFIAAPQVQECRCFKTKLKPSKAANKKFDSQNCRESRHRSSVCLASEVASLQAAEKWIEKALNAIYTAPTNGR